MIDSFAIALILTAQTSGITNKGWYYNSSPAELLCGATFQYGGEGNTYISLVNDDQQDAYFTIYNQNWTTVDGKSYDLNYNFGQKSYDGSSIGLKSNGSLGKGLSIRVNDEFMSSLASSQSLSITRNGSVVDDLNLSGSSEAVSIFRNCLASAKKVIATKIAQEEALAHIPFNPFKDETINKPPAPRNPAGWVSSNDYPSAARQDKLQGKTTFEVQVSPTGQATNCTVIETSGHSILDDATCRVVLRRARFKPATDANGDPTIGLFQTSITWSPPEN